jgi:hypothetical protein
MSLAAYLDEETFAGVARSAPTITPIAGSASSSTNQNAAPAASQP